MGRKGSAVLIMILLLAGCAGPPREGSPPAPGSENADEALPIRFSTCHKTVGQYPSPTAAFEAYLPSGFRIATSDDARQVFDLAVQTMSCGQWADRTVSRGAIITSWILVPVIPPASFAGLPGAHALLIDAHLSTSLLSDVVQERGVKIPADAPHMRFEQQTAPSGIAVFVITTEGVDYQYVERITIPSSQLEPVVGYENWWIANGTEDPVLLGVDTVLGRNLGSGTAALYYEGDYINDAPPASVGSAIALTGVEFTLLAIGSPNPAA